jgi:glycosyl-4,4'-diaponeurosporenoate acyltransferase
MPTWLVALLDATLWPFIHVGAARAGLRVPDAWLDPQRGWFRVRAWEQDGAWYERWFRVRAWKGRLPDGAAMLPGAFSKARIKSHDPAYLRRFAIEASRGEAVHWITLAFAPLFLPWNPAWADAVIVGYAIIANVPCIVAQRYNRARIVVLLEGR